MTETSKAEAWNRMINAMLNAEKQWKAFLDLKGSIEEIQTTPVIRRGMSAYAKASNFMWFLEGFMRYTQTVGGLKVMLIELEKKKEKKDAKT